jgi:hypothetical protein
VVEREEIITFAIQKEFEYIEASSLDNIGVIESFVKLAGKLIQ